MRKSGYDFSDPRGWVIRLNGKERIIKAPKPLEDMTEEEFEEFKKTHPSPFKYHGNPSSDS